jgi:hypothetical protein
MKSRLTAAAALLIATASGASAKELSNSDMRKLFPGNYSVVIFESYTLKVNMRSNGVITGKARGRTDTGKWSIEGTKLCVAWNTWTNGRKGCSALRRDDKGNLRGRGFYFKA